MTYTTNTRPAVHRGDVITIKDATSGYHETITVGTAAIIDDHGHVALHVHQAETGHLRDRRPQGRVDARTCRMPPPQGHALPRRASGRPVPALRMGRLAHLPRSRNARAADPARIPRPEGKGLTMGRDDETARYHDAVITMLDELIDRYGPMKLNAAILLDDVRRRCERIHETTTPRPK